MTMAVAVVEYKYTPDQMPVEELKRTFAARQGLLDLVLRHLRQQTQAASLSSFLLIGPRGSGKTTLVLMLCECIREDPALSAAWLPLRFREEQFEVCSLRDLLAAAVRGLADEGTPGADAWSSRVEQATDDEESQSLALAALRDLAKSQGKRLIFFVENLNLLMARAFDDTSQATLRRLLMVDPFLMLIGTAVQTFEEVEGYDKALFNYFHPLHLERLTDEQMCELLTRRAEYDDNAEFIERLGEHRPKLRALSRVTGGNPRFLLMVYEILSEGRLTSAVEVLRRLVDDLTPLLKHVLEGLPPQQAKILDALMRAGGTATPAGLAQSTRLKLNVVTAQLRRLKDNRMVEVLGGGKGQTAHYTIPDQLFCTWYQMRYLQQNRRRIELFVDVIRHWFEAKERWEHLCRLAERAVAKDTGQARSIAESAEYFAAALRDTLLEDDARALMIQTRLRTGDSVETAMAFADKSSNAADSVSSRGGQEFRGFSIWCRQHDLGSAAMETARKTAEEHPLNARAQLAYMWFLDSEADTQLYLDQLNRCLALPGLDGRVRSRLLFLRHLVNVGEDYDQAERDFDEAVHELVETTVRGLADVFRKWASRDYAGVVADCSGMIESTRLRGHKLAIVLTLRAAAKFGQNDRIGAGSDLNDAVRMREFAPERILRMLALSRCFDARGANLVTNLIKESITMLDDAPAPKMVEFIAKACMALAEPENRASWPTLVRSACQRLPPDAAKSMEFLLSTANLLEGKDQSTLDALPPEERALALEVVDWFGPQDDESEDDAALNERAS